MKKANLVLPILSFLFAACSSSTDEPDIEYMGPWEIQYYEDYHGLHNDSEEFVKWFFSR